MLNVLVVEDDDFQRNIIVRMLHSLSVSSVNEVDNGKSALEIIHKQDIPVDIILCDLNMPEMDGLEFLRHVGEEQHNIAIIIISALDSKLVMAAGRMTRMYGVKLLGAIEKPIYLEQLKGLFLKYDHSEQKWHQPHEDFNFSLGDILQGILNRQFDSFLQPKVDLQSGQVTGAEALARWIHPKYGLISPYAFIPILEKNNQIDILTFQILEKAVQACRSLHDRNCKISISVNLSQTLLKDITLADKITQIVKNGSVEPRNIILEITETAAMSGIAHTLENLARLCMNGFKLSIDDYGTGYSSLQQLTRIAFSELKIDQFFVKDSTINNAAHIVIKSSIDMARELNVMSVAEGVETQREWDMLKEMGCNMMQGYYIAEPMSLPSFIDKFALNNHSTPDSIVTYPSPFKI